MDAMDIGEPADSVVDTGDTGGIDMPRVRVSSMYDLKTGSKFGIIGIHTPTVGQLVTRYDGLLRNYKYLKVKSCSVKIACASTLPADPLQIGVSAGKISPADMMNPILYRAVSNDSWNAIINRIYSGAGWSAEAADGLDDAFSALNQSNSEKVYYSLLSGKEWRKVMPQQGLSVKGLKPLVHEVVSAFGQQFNPTPVYADSAANDLVAAAGAGATTAENVLDANTVFRGRSLPMPAIPTVVINANGSAVSNAPTIPRTFVMAIVTPPSQLQEFYYRMIVTWDIVFFGLRPATDLGGSSLVADGGYARYSRWSISQSKSLESVEDNTAKEVGCIDTLNTDPELVMES